jgi:hypothetical protein
VNKRGLVVWVPGYRSRGSGFNSRRYQIFWEVVGLERGPFSFVKIIEELLEWKSSGFSLKTEINGRWNSWRWPRDNFYPQRLALTSPTSGGRSVGIVRLRTKGTEFVQIYFRLSTTRKIRYEIKLKLFSRSEGSVLRLSIDHYNISCTKPLQNSIKSALTCFQLYSLQLLPRRLRKPSVSITAIIVCPFCIYTSASSL